MNGFGSLLLYYFTWRSVITGGAVFGLLLVALAANAMLFSPFLAFPLALGAYAFLLAFPYVSAPWALRKIIASRALALIPGLPLTAGCALLLLTAMMALFLPLSGHLVGIPAMDFWLAPKVFIMASLYAGLLQVILTSKYMSTLFSYLPLAAILLFSLFGNTLRALWASTAVVSLLALSSLVLWLYALYTLATKRNFKPVYHAAKTDLDNWNTAFTALFRIDGNPAANPAGTLLLATPASIPQRVVSISYAMVFTPLLSALLVQFTDDDGTGPLMGTRIFLLGSMVLSIFFSWMDGDAIPRSRLIWLRTPGGRAQVWTRLERELWIGHVLKAGIATALAVVAALVSDIPATVLLHFPLAIFSISLYESYLNLCARLYQWSSLPQAVAMLLSVAAIVTVAIHGARYVDGNVLLLLEVALVSIALLFRGLTQRGFNRVDWQLLRRDLARNAKVFSS